MEPIEAAVKVRWVFMAPLVDMREVGLHWYIRMQGSHEMLGVGPDKPDLRLGDIMKVTIEGPR